VKVPRLLIVSHDFPPSTGTSGRRPARLSAFLAERGAPPVIVTADPRFYGSAVLPGRSVREGLQVHEVRWSRGRSLMAKAGWPGRQAAKLSVVWAYRGAIRRALESGRKPDLLYFLGVPFWYFPLARRFGTRWGVPYALEFGDVFYMGGVRYRMGQRSGPRAWVDKVAEAYSVRGASLVVLTSAEQTELYRQRYSGMPRDLFVTIPWGYDAEALDAVCPAQRQRPDVFRLAIFGKFASYGTQDAVALANAVAAFHARRYVEALHLGSPEPELEAAFRREGLSDVFCSLGMVPYTEGLSVLASADCLVLNAISDVSIPVKVYDYIGVNRPVLAFVAAESAAGRLLARFPGALIVQTAEEALHALEAVAQRRLCQLQAGLDRAEFSQQRHFETLLEKLSAVVEQRRRATGRPCA